MLGVFFSGSSSTAFASWWVSRSTLANLGTSCCSSYYIAPPEEAVPSLFQKSTYTASPKKIASTRRERRPGGSVKGSQEGSPGSPNVLLRYTPGKRQRPSLLQATNPKRALGRSPPQRLSTPRDWQSSAGPGRRRTHSTQGSRAGGSGPPGRLTLLQRYAACPNPANFRFQSFACGSAHLAAHLAPPSGCLSAIPARSLCLPALYSELRNYGLPLAKL